MAVNGLGLLRIGAECLVKVGEMAGGDAYLFGNIERNKTRFETKCLSFFCETQVGCRHWF
jgi:hypothetical protein